MGSMRYEFFFQKDRSIVEIRAFGQATAAGFAELNINLVEHRDWTPGMNVLGDFRKLDLSDLTIDDAQESSNFAQTLSERFGSGKIACVMKKDIDYGIARMWEMLTQNGVSVEIRVFRSISAARTWLRAQRKYRFSPFSA
jgi:hypothetical protein